MPILIVQDLDVPFNDILAQANGDKWLELKLAASFGYAQACSDLKNTDHFSPENNEPQHYHRCSHRSLSRGK